jgi:hypothetical protein
MKHLLRNYCSAIFLIAIFVTGCLPPGEYGGTSPYEDKARAEGRIQATNAARVEQEAQATRQAAREAGQAENEIRRVMAPVQAKQTEMVLESTAIANRAAAAALDAEQTSTARQAQLADLEAEKRRIELQIEMDRRRRLEANAAAWDSIWRWAWPLLLLAIGGAAAAALYFLPSRWLAHRIRQERLKNSILLLTDGSGRSTTIWLDEQDRPEIIGATAGGSGNNGSGRHEPASPGALAGTWGDGESMRTVGASGNVLISRPRLPDRSTTGQALVWVQASVKKFGPYQDKLLGHEQMGWGSSKWQRIKKSMGDIVETIDGKETFLREGGPYQCLAELEQVLREGRLALRPSPTPLYPTAGD